MSFEIQNWEAGRRAIRAFAKALPVIQCKHGTLEVRGFQQLDLGGWLRKEIWYPRIPRVGETYESTHVAARGDLTPPHDKNKGYDQKCGWCFGNAPRSEALHRQEVERARQPGFLGSIEFRQALLLRRIVAGQGARLVQVLAKRRLARRIRFQRRVGTRDHVAALARFDIDQAFQDGVIFSEHLIGMRIDGAGVGQF